MSTFIKAGFWEKLCKPCKGYKGWLNLDELIQSFIPKPTYKVFTALLTQSGGDAFMSTNNEDPLPFIIGVSYYIEENNNSAADFTNIGAPDNNGGTHFIATGTTPASWGNGNYVNLTYNLGAPVVTVLENTIGNIWFTYINTGGYGIVSDSLFTINKTFNIISQATVCTTCKTRAAYMDVSNINISTASGIPLQPSNGVLSDGDEYPTSIEIRVYS